METGNAIELKGVTKRFGDVIANDNVNLTVRKGEILSILGENGSGKTTLMNMLSGIYFPDEGEVYVDGKEARIKSPSDAIRYGFCLLTEDRKQSGCFLSLSVRLNTVAASYPNMQKDPLSCGK